MNLSPGTKNVFGPRTTGLNPINLIYKVSCGLSLVFGLLKNWSRGQSYKAKKIIGLTPASSPWHNPLSPTPLFHHKNFNLFHITQLSLLIAKTRLSIKPGSSSINYFHFGIYHRSDWFRGRRKRFYLLYSQNIPMLQNRFLLPQNRSDL